MSDVILMTGVGSYLPKNKFSNEDLSQFIDTSDEWITKRSGIKSRHFVSKNELTSDLATNAALKAIKMSELNINDIDRIIVATTTPDNTFPSTATRVQQKLGAKGIAFDVQAVCAGFVFALSVASSMMKDNHSKNCIVIGADSMSKLLNWEDRTTSVLFGDGAGAAILQKEENLDKKFEDAYKAAGVELVYMSEADHAAWIEIAKKTSHKAFAEQVPGGAKLMEMALAVK